MIVEQLKVKRGILSSSSTPTGIGTSIVAEKNEMIQESGEKETDIAINRNRPTKPLQILLVEDNLINQKVIVSILTRWKCEVTTAINGLAGFEERTSHRGKKAFDLCFMDLHMVRIVVRSDITLE